ncbi:5-epiaristolochene 1,3-dihydroxylase [Nicotiana attenuata]|uniref:5-epiaristolochene 1,3-dihydroxylase n=1 Tax=Nicotiana attenuata TaxID=49451 RepID=A0A1J6KFL8_NICAT|nr:5-epiaristolochene 1,3-dihydroxylase [Nicotiana attenuata]
MRKVCVTELLSAKSVRSFSSIRRDEACRLVQHIQSSTPNEPINITKRISWYESSITCKAAFGELLKDQEKFKFIEVLKEVLALAGGFSVPDIFPSIKILHFLSGMRGRILNAHKRVDAIVEDVINEHKKNLANGKAGNGALGGEDLVNVLLRLKESGELQIPITNDNIKAVMIFPFNLTFLFLFLSFLFLLLGEWKKSSKKLPPGPWKLPILGSIHHLALEGGLPHHALANLAKKYGPDLMHLQLGEISMVVVSSLDMAREVLKTHDLAFASRPKLLALEIIFYKSTDIAFSAYGDYWRQMRKVAVLELLSAKNVRSFTSIRHDEASRLVQIIRSSPTNEPINVTERILWYESSMTCKAAFGELLKDQKKFILIVRELTELAGGFSVADIFPSIKILPLLSGMRGRILNTHKRVDAIVEDVINEHKKNLANGKAGNGALGGEDLVDVLLRLKESGELQIPITNDNIKAVMIDLFSAGTETSSTTTIWAMTEIMRNPRVFAKAQAEVREVFKGKETIDEDKIEELKYLKQVVKETLRLHPPLPLLVPRECREETNINGYTIPLKTRVMVNVWAIGRDQKYWEDAEEFKPERFEQSSVDFMGNNFEFLPFGSGRRMCPGISFGLINVHLPLAKLLYHFDWKLPNGVKPEDLDMTEFTAITAARKSELYLIATPYHTSQE